MLKACLFLAVIILNDIEHFLGRGQHPQLDLLGADRLQTWFGDRQHFADSFVHSE